MLPSAERRIMKTLLTLLSGSVLMFTAIDVSCAEEGPTKVTPLQLAIWNPVQLVPEDWDVYGLRLSLLHGKNDHVYGLDAGFENFATEMNGIQVALAGNVAIGRMTGIQLGLVNIIKESPVPFLPIINAQF